MTLAGGLLAALDAGLSSEPSATSRAGAVPPAVVFDQCQFAFDDHVVLRDISFSVPKGSMRSCSARAAPGNPSC